MTLTEQTGQIHRENPPAVQTDPDHVGQDTDGAKASDVKSPMMGSRGRPLLGLVFATGVLLGWLVIGWWLWPVKWNNAEPWLLRPEFQWTYIPRFRPN